MEFESSVLAIVGDVDGIPGSWLQPQPSKEHVDGESLSPLSLPVSLCHSAFQIHVQRVFRSAQPAHLCPAGSSVACGREGVETGVFVNFLHLTP